jgi:hypothetical protein
MSCCRIRRARERRAGASSLPAYAQHRAIVPAMRIAVLSVRAPRTEFPGTPIGGNELELEAFGSDAETRFVIVGLGLENLGR